LSEITRGGVESGGGSYFFSYIKGGGKKKKKKKKARSFYISDTNLKEPGEGSQIFQPFARGGSLYFRHSIHNFHPPSLLLISEESLTLLCQLFAFRVLTTVVNGIGEFFSPSQTPAITIPYINDVSY